MTTLKSANMKLSAVFTPRLAALAFAILALPAPAMAAPTRPIRFDRLSLEQGLSQSAVMDVLQDRRGYIWLATEDGLKYLRQYPFKAAYAHVIGYKPVNGEASM